MAYIKPYNMLCVKEPYIPWIKYILVSNPGVTELEQVLKKMKLLVQIEHSVTNYKIPFL